MGWSVEDRVAARGVWGSRLRTMAIVHCCRGRANRRWRSAKEKVTRSCSMGRVAMVPDAIARWWKIVDSRVDTC